MTTERVSETPGGFAHDTRRCRGQQIPVADLEASGVLGGREVAMTTCPSCGAVLLIDLGGSGVDVPLPLAGEGSC